MTSKEALNTICLECQKYKGKIQVACPFRSISNDYCDEYEQIEKDLEVLEIIRKHSFLDLSVLADYDKSEFDEYFDDWHDTTNELDRKEFELLKEWLNGKQ